MQNHDRRSHVPPLPPAPERTGQKPHQRWECPDVPRPAAPVRMLLPTLDPAVADVEPPEPMTRLECTALLPQAARDFLRRLGPEVSA